MRSERTGRSPESRLGSEPSMMDRRDIRGGAVLGAASEIWGA